MQDIENSSLNRALSVFKDELRDVLWHRRKVSEMSNVAQDIDIIGNFEAFARAHIDFFNKGLSGSHDLHELREDTTRGYTREFALRIVAQRLQLDFETWRQIFLQRPIFDRGEFRNLTEGLSQLKFVDILELLTHDTDSENNDVTGKIAFSYNSLQFETPQDQFKEILENIFPNYLSLRWVAKLSQADYLAEHVLRFAVQCGYLLQETHAWSYFSTKPSMRVVPYVHIAMVSIPFSACKVNQDLLTIPHEIGHYVYWHGQINVDTNDEQYIYQIAMQTKEPILHQWSEEIFADVFGTLIAGGLLAIDFQNYFYSQHHLEFEFTDGKHPIPALRPAIYYKTLEYLCNYKNAKSHAEKLRTKWLIDLKSRGITPKTLFQIDHNQSINLCEFEKMLDDAFTNPTGIFRAFTKPEVTSNNQLTVPIKNWMEIIKCDTDSSTDDWINTWNIFINSDKVELDDENNGTTSLQVALGLDIPIQLANSSNQADGKNIGGIDKKTVSWQEWFENHGFLSEQQREEVSSEHSTLSIQPLGCESPPIDNNKIQWTTEQWLRVLDAGDWTIEGPHASKHDD